MQAYSEDLRTRVVALVNKGRSCRSVAHHFDVSPSFVIKTVQRFRKTGEIRPKTPQRTRVGKLSPHKSFLISLINERSDTTLYEMRDALLQNFELSVNPASIHRFLVKHGYSYKKNVGSA